MTSPDKHKTTMSDIMEKPSSKWTYLKIAVLAWCLIILLGIFMIQYLRRNPQNNIEFNIEDDEMIVRTLKLYQQQDREKRHVDPSTYKQMGWKFTPKEAKIVFNAYYNCLRRQNKSYNRKSYIKAILALEGQTVKMTCNACFRPDQDPDNYDIEWQHLRSQDGVLSYVESNNRFKISDQKMLVIPQVDIVDAGQYFCVQSSIREYIEIYQVDVIFRERRRILPESAMKDILPPYELKNHNLKVFTLWSEWSGCNYCNKLGKRRKVGICMVSKLDKNKPVEPVDMPIIELYPDGIPCRSTVLPRKISKIRKILLRRSETLMGNCFIKCPTTPAFILVRDSSGRVVETVDAGYYSIKNKPTLPPLVKRDVIYTTTGEKVVLTCPHSSKKKNMARWQNGSIPLNPLSIRRQTRGRVRIDSVNRLHIRGLRKSDTAIYSCWVFSRLVSTIKVIITSGVNPQIHVIISTTGLVLTVICSILICFCMLCSKVRKSRAAS